MKKIQFNENNIVDYFNEGFESNIYLYKDNNYDDTVLLKKFKFCNPEERIVKTDIKRLIKYLSCYDLNDIILKNKEKKINIIGNNKIFENEVKILDTVYDNNDFVGYTMKKSHLNKLDSFSKRKLKISQLKTLRKKVEDLNSNNIFIGDFDEKNILSSSDGNIIKLCDLDNFKIDKFDFDTITRAIYNFREKCNKDEYIDSYCFNLFTISYLFKVNYTYLSEYLNDFTLPYFYNKDCKEILDSMKHLDNSYQYKFIIDNIK